MAARAQAPAKPKVGLTITGEARFRYENRENAAFWDAQDKNPKDELARFRLGFNYQFENGPRIYIQPQFNWQHDSCVAVSTGTDWEGDIFNGYIEFGGKQQLWRVGRQELLFGEGRLIAPSNWSNSGRSYDAARLTIADKRTKTDLFVGKVGHVGPKYPHPLFAGLYSTITPRKDLSYDLYLLFKSLDVNPTTLQEIYTIGSRPKAKWGPIDAYGEAAYQFGKYGARTVSAYAYTGNVGYTFKGPLGLRLAAEYDFASGGNPTEGTYTTFDQMFLTNHSVVDSILGMYDGVGWRNMREWRVNALMTPARKWTVSLDGHFFMLDNAIDYWYGKGGAPMPGYNGKGIRDATGASGRDLGSEADISVSYEVCKGLVLAAQYAHFMPGSFVRSANGGHADEANWFMFQTEYKW
jgi:hypothetical protein